MFLLESSGLYYVKGWTVHSPKLAKTILCEGYVSTCSEQQTLQEEKLVLYCLLNPKNDLCRKSDKGCSVKPKTQPTLPKRCICL